MGWSANGIKKNLQKLGLRVRKCNGETQVIRKDDLVVFRTTEDLSNEKLGEAIATVDPAREAFAKDTGKKRGATVFKVAENV